MHQCREALGALERGETPSGAGAVASHTGTLAGENKIWENGLRQAGITRARSLEEVVGTAMAFLYLPPAQGRRSFILGGGEGIVFITPTFASATACRFRL